MQRRNCTVQRDDFNRASRSKLRSITAPAGEYLVQAKMADDTVVEATASVKPGERTEIALP